MRLFDRALLIMAIWMTGSYLMVITENMVLGIAILFVTMYAGSIFWFFEEGNILSRFTHEVRSQEDTE